MKEDFAVVVKVRSAFTRDKLASRMSFCIMTHIFRMIFLHRSCNFHCRQVNGFHVETPKSTKYGQHSIGWQYASKMAERQFSIQKFCRDFLSLQKSLEISWAWSIFWGFAMVPSILWMTFLILPQMLREMAS